MHRNKEKWEIWIFPREAPSEVRAQCVNRAWVLASCKLAALIFTKLHLYIKFMKLHLYRW